MNLKLNDMQVLHLLEALRDVRMHSLFYYKEYKDEKKKIGITPPEEWEELYNTIIKQLHEQGQFKILKPIKTESKTSCKDKVVIGIWKKLK